MLRRLFRQTRLTQRLQPPIWVHLKKRQVWLGGKYRMAAYYHETMNWTRCLSGASTTKAYQLVNQSPYFRRERLHPMDEQLFYRNSPNWMAWNLLHKDGISSIKKDIPIPDCQTQFQFSHPVARHLQHLARLSRIFRNVVSKNSVQIGLREGFFT